MSPIKFTQEECDIARAKVKHIFAKVDAEMGADGRFKDLVSDMRKARAAQVKKDQAIGLLAALFGFIVGAVGMQLILWAVR